MGEVCLKVIQKLSEEQCKEWLSLWAPWEQVSELVQSETFLWKGIACQKSFTREAIQGTMT